MPTNLIIPDNQQPQERDGYWCHLPTRIATLPGIDVWALVFAPFGSDAFDRETIAEIGAMLGKLPKPQIQSMFVAGEQWVIVFAANADQPDYAQELASMIVRGLDATLGCLMSTANLTDAQLAEIEARWAAVVQAAEDAGSTVNKLMAHDCHEDVTALLAAVREARALVEALVEAGPPACENYCAYCLGEWEGRLQGYDHADDCAWQAAREAVEAWKGNE